ncbi:hypothetical protein cypCar_00032933 [Cyprinus carpio]|nr:hypothetical protein cypCar_00032933 [Cyprinus carpio]
MVLTCKNGKFGDKDSIKMNYDNSGVHQCKPENDEECTDATCATALIKILMTALIGWAIYIVCAQPTARGGYQGNKASDRQALINNHAPSGGDTYQPLNTRTDEYSTLHAQRKQKNKQSV